MQDQGDLRGIDGKLECLRRLLRPHRPLAVAYSGGVDSAFLLAVAGETLGRDGAVGILADSPSLPRQTLADALELARWIGVRVEVIRTHELDDPAYAANPPDRCYHCRRVLFARMVEIARARGFAAIAYGENAEDAHEDRPGRRAAREFAVLTPLRDAGLDKAEIRELSRRLGVPSADRPSQTCLSTRLPCGTPITAEALAMIEHAEGGVRRLGLRVFRVRHLPHGPGARLEVDPVEMARLPDLEVEIRARLAEAGYRFVEIDPKGYCPPGARSPGEARG